MKRQVWFASVLLALLQTAPAMSEPQELRTITTGDGSVYRGAVVATDDESLTLKTLKGEVKLSVMDIIQVDPLEREAWLTQEGRRWIYLGVQTPTGAAPSSLQRAAAIDAILLEVLQRDELLVVPPQALGPELDGRIRACTDLDCRVEALRGQNSPVLYGLLQGRDKQERLILRRLNGSLDQDNELIISLGDIAAERNRLVRSAALLLGEKPPADPVIATRPVDSSPVTPAKTDPRSGPGAQPEATPGTPGTAGQTAASGPTQTPATGPKTPATGQATGQTDTAAQASGSTKPSDSTKPSVSTKPSDTAQASGLPTSTTDQTPASPGTATPSVQTRLAWPGLDLGHARRLDLLPIPGASSLFYFKDRQGAAVALGTVAAFTTVSLYLAGDMRLLGLDDGLPVGWTYPDRGLQDGLLLTGVGAASFVVTTWIVNQAVRAVVVQRYKKTHALTAK